MLYRFYKNTSVTPRNLKIGLNMPKAFRKLKKIEAKGGNDKIEFQLFFLQW